MQTNNDLNIITEHIRQNLSWKEMYFRHFSVKQKILFFMPLILFLAPVWGTLMLFQRDIWWAFILGGIGMFVGIYFFFNQKKSFEQKIFSKLYASTSCITELDYQIEKIKELMFENNLLDKRNSITHYFNKTTYPSVVLIPIILAIWIPMFINNNTYKLIYYSIYISALFVFIAVVFALPAFVPTGSKGTARLIFTEMEKREANAKE